MSRHSDTTGTNTVGTETPWVNHLTHPFTPRLPPTDDVRADGHLKAMREPEMGYQNGLDVTYKDTSGMSAELLRGAASESSALVAPIDGSRATQNMQMIRGRNGELASFFPSPSMLDLTVVAASADASLHHAVIEYNLCTP